MRIWSQDSDKGGTEPIVRLEGGRGYITPHRTRTARALPELKRDDLLVRPSCQAEATFVIALSRPGRMLVDAIPTHIRRPALRIQ
ncbi:hypothetical protein ANO11243_073460 [Dothideomycetidae sp. 11243]|nr:hypothetical protein ANO11243_073460 [fungal sp. No.11243]